MSHFFNRKVLAWENKPKTAGIYIGFMLGVYFLEPWMITLGLVIPFLKNIVVSTKLKYNAATEMRALIGGIRIIIFDVITFTLPSITKFHNNLDNLSL